MLTTVQRWIPHQNGREQKVSIRSSEPVLLARPPLQASPTTGQLAFILPSDGTTNVTVAMAENEDNAGKTSNNEDGETLDKEVESRLHNDTYLNYNQNSIKLIINENKEGTEKGQIYINFYN